MNQILNLLLIGYVVCVSASDVLTDTYELPIGHSTYGVPLPTNIDVFKPPTTIIDIPSSIGHDAYGIPIKYAKIFKEPPVEIITNPQDDIVDAKFIHENGHYISKVESLNQKYHFKYPNSNFYSVYPHTSVHYREHHHPIFASLLHTNVHKPTIDIVQTPSIETTPFISKHVEIYPEIPVEIPPTSATTTISDNTHYHSGYILDNGTKVSEEGKLISTQNGWENVIAKKGSYEYISPEGVPIKVNWVADENGFRLE